MRNGTQILIPVKNLRNAKQRLASILSPGERCRLAEAMLEDVLGTLAARAAGPPVAVVTSDPLAVRLARRFVFEVLHDPDNLGETEAITLATTACQAEGTGTLVLPADIPLLEAGELERVLAAAPEEGTVLVPSADGRGSNAVLRRPGALFPLTFGGESFERHLQRARATGLPCVTLRSPGIALDVDTPADLRSLLAAQGNTRAQRLLREWNLPERLLAGAQP